jgi:cytochrome c biogenesis protein
MGTDQTTDTQATDTRATGTRADDARVSEGRPGGATALSTAPDAGAARRVRGRGPVAVARRWWRQLTSMRTALLLLFLLAVAAAPGSMLPQHNLNQDKVTQYYADHPTLAPLLDRAGMFDVFSSPWFAAIYVLLFVSLVGCLTPRIRLHVRAMLRTPPDAPRQLARLRLHDGFTLDGEPGPAAERVHKLLRRQRFRSVVRRHDDGTVTVSAEKGFLRETGNLLFHISLVIMLVGVALGAGFGWHGGRLLLPGADNAFCNSLQQYDQYSLGSWVSAGDLPPFCVTLDDFHAHYLDNGQPLAYYGDVSYQATPNGPTSRYKLQVNDPLRVDGASVYLVGHGYAPVIRYTDRYGRSQTVVAPFLPQDSNLTSDGVAVFPDANVDPKTGVRDPSLQVAFQGVFYPTAPTGSAVRSSTWPGQRNPELVLFAYRGDTGIEAGIPHSVYTLDQEQIHSGQLKQVTATPLLMKPGATKKLDDGTTVTFVRVQQWATLQVRRDPGERVVLVAGVLLLAGLLGSLTVRRRRVWFRFGPAGAGTAVTAGGLARTGYAGFGTEFRRLVATASGRSEED